MVAIAQAQGLTPEEEAEYQELLALEQQAQGLTPEEEAEYQELLALEQQAQGLTPEEEAEYQELLALEQQSAPATPNQDDIVAAKEQAIVQEQADNAGLSMAEYQELDALEQQEREYNLDAALQTVVDHNPLTLARDNFMQAVGETNQAIRDSATAGKGFITRGLSDEAQPLDMAKGVGMYGLAALQQGFQPGEVLADTFFGQPIGETLESLGISPEWAQMWRTTVTGVAEGLGGAGLTRRVGRIMAEENPGMIDEFGNQRKSFGAEHSGKNVPDVPASSADELFGGPSNSKRFFEEGQVPTVAGVPVVLATDPAVEVNKILMDRSFNLSDLLANANATKIYNGNTYRQILLGKEGAKAVGPNDVVDIKLNENAVDELQGSVEAAVRGDFDESQRMFLNIAGKIEAGEFDPRLIPAWLEKYDLTPGDAAMLYKDTISTAGRQLQQVSKFSKAMQVAFKDDPKIAAMFRHMENDVDVYPSWVSQTVKAANALAQSWRVALITQPATAIRNLETQAGRMVVQSLDEVLRPIFKSQSLPETFNEMRNGMNHLIAIYSRATAKGRSRMDEFFETGPGLEAQAQMLGQPVHELAVKSGGVLDKMNFLNRAQEFYTRRVAYEASLRSQLRKMGLDFNTVDPEKVPKAVYEKAVDHALEMSMQANPSSEVISDLVKAWGANPVTTFILPFPRFVFGNLMPFIKSHSPIGFLDAFGDKALHQMAKGNPEEFSKAMSRATLGTMGLGIAIDHRMSENAGERWDTFEKTDGTQRESIKALAPFSLYYLLAEGVVNPHRMSSRDYVAGFLGLSKPQNTPLGLAEIMNKRDDESAGEAAARVTGEIVAGYTTFFRQFKDYESVFNPDAVIARDTKAGRDNEMFALAAPTLNNLPMVYKMLPHSRSLLRESALRFEAPSSIFGIQLAPEYSTVLRQFTGRTEQTPTELEKAALEVKLDPAAYQFRTGVPEIDRKLAEIGAPIAKTFYQNLQDSGYLDRVAEHLAKRGFSEEEIMDTKAYMISGALADVEKQSLKALIQGDIEASTGFDPTQFPGLQQAKAVAKFWFKENYPVEAARLGVKAQMSKTDMVLFEKATGINIKDFVNKGEIPNRAR